MNIKFFLSLLFAFPLMIFGQEQLEAKLVVEKGKFIFDKKSYKLLKTQVDEISKKKKKNDSMMKINPSISYMVLDCRVTEIPRLNSKTTHFTALVNSNLNLKNIKRGKNLMSIVVKKNGIAGSFKCIEASDEKICNQIKRMFRKEEFKTWHNALFSSIAVDYHLTFSIIVDTDFTNYNLRNKWSLDNNIQDFEK